MISSWSAWNFPDSPCPVTLVMGIMIEDAHHDDGQLVGDGQLDDGNADDLESDT